MLRNFMWLLGIWLILAGCSKNRAVFNETQQGDFYLSSGLVFYQKSFAHTLNFSSAEEALTAGNLPHSGLQVKFNENDVIKGVLLNHQVDWQAAGQKKIKVPDILRRPLNASFQIEKDGMGYKVTVRDIWFSDTQSGGKQKNNEIEFLWVQKKGFAFKRDKKTIQAIHYLSDYFSDMFLVKGAVRENRF